MIATTQPSLPWSAAQDEQLRALIRGNFSISDIALRLGRRPDAVFRRARQLGALKLDQPARH